MVSIGADRGWWAVELIVSAWLAGMAALLLLLRLSGRPPATIDHPRLPDVPLPAAACLQELVAAFAADDLQHAAELTTQLRYICRIREAIADKL